MASLVLDSAAVARRRRGGWTSRAIRSGLLGESVGDARIFALLIFCPSFGLEGVSGWGWLCLWYMVHCMVRWNIKGGAREQSHAHDTPPPTPQPRAPTPVTASAHARVQ